MCSEYQRFDIQDCLGKFLGVGSAGPAEQVSSLTTVSGMSVFHVKLLLRLEYRNSLGRPNRGKALELKTYTAQMCWKDKVK